MALNLEMTLIWLIILLTGVVTNGECVFFMLFVHYDLCKKWL